jgi:hypothetical protein
MQPARAKERNLVLDIEYAPGAFVAAVEDALNVVQKQSDLLFLYAGEAHVSATMTIYRWKEGLHKRDMVTFVDDRKTPARYVSVQTDDDRAFDALLTTLPVVPFPVLKQRAAEPDAEPAALVRIAIASTDEPDPEAVSLIEAGLSSGDPARVDAAVMAAALTHWPPLVPSLKRVHERTQDEGIRRLAAQAIENCGGPLRRGGMRLAPELMPRK